MVHQDSLLGFFVAFSLCWIMWSNDFQTSLFKCTRFKASETIDTRQLNATSAAASSSLLHKPSTSSFESDTLVNDAASDEWTRLNVSLEFDEIILYDNTE